MKHFLDTLPKNVIEKWCSDRGITDHSTNSITEYYSTVPSTAPCDNDTLITSVFSGDILRYIMGKLYGHSLRQLSCVSREFNRVATALLPTAVMYRGWEECGSDADLYNVYPLLSRGDHTSVGVHGVVSFIGQMLLNGYTLKLKLYYNEGMMHVGSGDVVKYIATKHGITVREVPLKRITCSCPITVNIPLNRCTKCDYEYSYYLS